jgi:HPt (histidine-containing phosphotransfer) domain-containing protein
MALSPEALAEWETELRAEYVAGLGPRIQELREALAACATDPEAREALRRGGHRLAGTAQTVGLGPLGVVGRALERFCTRTDWGPAAVDALGAAVALLVELSALAVDGGALPEPHGDARYQRLEGP